MAEEYWREELARVVARRAKKTATIARMQFHLEDAKKERYWGPYMDEMAAKIPWLTRDLERLEREETRAREVLRKIRNWSGPQIQQTLDYESD